MLQFVLDGDHNYFVHINQEWTNTWFDSFMPFITEPSKVRPLDSRLALVYMLYKKRRKGLSHYNRMYYRRWAN